MKIPLITRTLIMTSILLILAVGIYAILILTIRGDNRTISEIQGRIDVALKEEQKLQAAQLLVKDISENENELNASFIANDGVVSFLETVESLGKTTGASITVKSVTLEPITYGDDVEDKFVEFLRLSISAEGSWREVFHTTSLLEGMPFGVKIHQISIDELRGSEREWVGLMDISFTKLK